MAKIPINIATGTLQKEEIIVGIDLGTTNSLVAIIHPAHQQPLVLKEHDSSSLVPSIVYFNPNGQVEVGEAAKDFLEKEPENTIFSAKRLMGKSYKDIAENAAFFTYKILDNDTDDLVKIQLKDKFYSPIELSAFILSELKKRAEHILKTSVYKAVITVPAYFNDTQRQATRDAGKLAGLDVLRIINEPTAACLAYGFGKQHNQKQTIAVYDWGGGTFDISILDLHQGIFEVLSTHGDTYLGGDDMDRVIMEYWMDNFAEAKKMDKAQLQGLRLQAEAAKKTLTAAPKFEAHWNDINLSLTQEKFETLIEPLITKTIASCTAALKDAGLEKTAIDAILMVGGTTRIPLVKKSIGDFFGKRVDDSLNPDEVVAMGAAIQADILAGNNKDFLLLDITPLSLGVETAGGLMDVLIPRNAKIPTQAARQYTTQKDGQTGMRIAVYQGERDLVLYNRKLAAFNLTEIPPMPAGLPKVEINFLINADGILTVRAKELRSGIMQQVEVKPQYGITDEEIETMLAESLQNAAQDIAQRALTEAITEAEQLIHTTAKFIEKNAGFLSKAEIENTKTLIQQLQQSITEKDKTAVQQNTERLNEFSRPYAERVMDQAISQAMKGKTI